MSNTQLDELLKFKEDLYKKVKDTKAYYIADEQSDLVEAITKVFGADKVNGEITLDMITDCIKIVKSAGKDKADSILGRF